MLEKIYQRLRFWVSKDGEKGKISAGFLPPRIRSSALSLIDPKKGKLLEVGCGEGLFIIAAARKFPNLKITAIEGSEKVAEETKRKINSLGLANIQIIIAKASATGFEARMFDWVVCPNMLYNLNSRKEVGEVIKEMARIVKNEGRIIFDIRNRLNPLMTIAYKLAKFYDPHCPTPVTSHTLKETIDLLSAHNLKIKRIVPVVRILGILPLAYVIEAEKS